MIVYWTLEFMAQSEPQVYNLQLERSLYNDGIFRIGINMDNEFKQWLR